MRKKYAYADCSFVYKDQERARRLALNLISRIVTRDLQYFYSPTGMFSLSAIISNVNV